MAKNATSTAPIDAALQAAAKGMASLHLRDLIYQIGREKFSFTFEDLQVDCTRQPITTEIFEMLLLLADSKSLRQSIDDMFAGQPINITESRPVLHCMLRTPDYQKRDEYKKLATFADAVRADKSFSAVVNLGIGGSSLGPAMVTQGLAGFHDGPAVHYVGNIDPSALHDVLKKCDPQSTLIIVTSKTFTTQETLANAALAKDWLAAHGVASETAMAAVTATAERAAAWGIKDANIFTFDDSVGGRYSLWSAVGLSVMIAIGSKAFGQLLDGAYHMDRHFKDTPFATNIPVIMGLLRVWHRRYLGHMAYGLMPYDQRLARLPAWAQQLEMESNGKGVDRAGHALSAPSGPLIWGEPGTNGQHSFFQWLHQSSDIVPIDILVTCKPIAVPHDKQWHDNHRMLAINAVAQAEALAIGQGNVTEPHRHFPGNRPSIMLSWEANSPYALGRLLALYEHVTVVSGFLLDVNSFDQWGVELGKQMANDLGKGGALANFSPAAHRFLRRL
jgi:glucose-6-phosphate isomerase